jgi:tetratricopeptide (TPR) repeat protein
MSRKSQLPAGLLILLVVAATYSNHFQNSFHFDDWHAVTQNPAIRTLKNLPSFFTDARTISTLPANQMYRPLLATSLALDYWLGGGLKPFYFHLSTFLWFLALLGLMLVLFRHLVESRGVAWAAVAWFGLHPACAETVNYVVQRADLLATVGVAGALLLWIAWPDGRKYGAYLAPMVLGALTKPTALVFAPILAGYLYLYEGRRRVMASAPAFAAAGALYLLQSAMLPRTVVLGGVSAYRYWITQPLVTVHYFVSFFLPLWLSADTDRQALRSLWSAAGLAGVGFVLGLAGAAWWCARDRKTRPIAFGILWFLAGLAPTAVVPLAEVENDHRMFLPFVGLALAVCQAAALLWERAPRGRAWQAAGAASMACLLAGYAAGTYQRNRVWHSEESLWLDVTEKSPRNGRGLMNYGLTQMEKGEIPRALDFFQRAAVFTPDYAFLEINLGIATAALDRDAEAEAHFQRALALAPNDSVGRIYYARWLKTRGRIPECASTLLQALERNPRDPDARYLLMQVYAEQQNWGELKPVALETLKLFRDDRTSLEYLAKERAFQEQVSRTEDLAKRIGSPEGYLSLSLIYHRAGRYRDSIAAAREALRLRPLYAEAFNNVAAGYEGLGQWEEAIQAAEQALRIQPDNELARNNLIYARSKIQQTGARPR